MSDPASFPSIWALLGDRPAAAAGGASDEDVAYHQMDDAACSSPPPTTTTTAPDIASLRAEIASGIASIEALTASLRARQDLAAYHQRDDAAFSSPATPNQTTTTTPGIASPIWASVGARRAAAAAASDQDLAYHRMEAACPSPTPKQTTRRTPRNSNRPPPSNFFKIAMRTFMTLSGIIFTVSPFVWGFVYHILSSSKTPWR